MLLPWTLKGLCGFSLQVTRGRCGDNKTFPPWLPWSITTISALPTMRTHTHAGQENKPCTACACSGGRSWEKSAVGGCWRERSGKRGKRCGLLLVHSFHSLSQSHSVVRFYQPHIKVTAVKKTRNKRSAHCRKAALTWNICLHYY